MTVALVISGFVSWQEWKAWPIGPSLHTLGEAACRRGSRDTLYGEASERTEEGGILVQRLTERGRGDFKQNKHMPDIMKIPSDRSKHTLALKIDDTYKRSSRKVRRFPLKSPSWLRVLMPERAIPMERKSSASSMTLRQA